MLKKSCLGIVLFAFTLISLTVHAAEPPRAPRDLLQNPPKIDCSSIDLAGSWVFSRRTIVDGSRVNFIDLRLEHDSSRAKDLSVYPGKELEDGCCDLRPIEMKMTMNRKNCTVQTQLMPPFLMENNFKILSRGPVQKQGDFILLGICIDEKCTKLNQKFYVKMMSGYMNYVPGQSNY